MPTTHTFPHSSAHRTPLFLSILIVLATLLSLPALAGSLFGGYGVLAFLIGPPFGSVAYQWDDIQKTLSPRAIETWEYLLGIPVLIGGCLGWYALACLLLSHSNRAYVELTTAFKCHVAGGVLVNLVIAAPFVGGALIGGPVRAVYFAILVLIFSPTVLCGLLIYKAKRYNPAGLLATGDLPNAPFQA